MNLVRLEIGRLPGLSGPLVVDDIAEACNLVVGPNGSGKSSLVRALRLLVDGNLASGVDVEIRGSFRQGDALWQATRSGPRVIWTVDGRRTDRPSLPDGDDLRPYRLDLASLIGADEDERRLLAELRRSLRGGCDLEALRVRDPFLLRPRAGRSEAKALGSARRRLREVERSRAELRRNEARLPDLERTVASARRGADEVRDLLAALELLEACRELRQARTLFEAFPPSLERLSGDEGARLVGLDEEGDRLGREWTRVSALEEEAGRRLASTGFAEGGPDPVGLAAASRDLVELGRLDGELERLRREREAAALAEREAREALGEGALPPRLDPRSLSEAEKLAGALQALETARRDRAARLAEGPESPEPSEIEACARASEALRRWLAADGVRNPWLRPLLVLSAAALLVLAFLAHGRGEGPLAGGAVAVALVLSVTTFVARDDRKGARERFGRAFEEPLWRRDAVALRLEEIEARGAELVRRRDEALRAREGRRELEVLDGELVLLRQRKEELALRLGFDPALTALGFHAFVRLVDAYAGARQALALAEADGEDLLARRQALLDGLRAVVSPWETTGDGGLHSLEAALESLQERHRRADEARRALAEAGRERENLETAKAGREERERALFEAAGLPRGERNELLRRLELLPSWREARDRLLTARKGEALFRRPLEGRPDLLEAAEALDEAELRGRLDRARERAALLEPSEAELARIRAELAVAGEGAPLEGALADVDGSLRALEKRRDQALSAELASFLLDDIEAEHRVENEPELIRSGRDLFGRFTGHAFELRVDDGGFRARDCALDVERGLDELSSATRMQLLLALRLAWIERIEAGGPALPLFFDEALTNSDVERFGQVARALDELAREGRQVFYLSARAYEELLWKEATGRCPHKIDLPSLRGRVLPLPESYGLVERDPLPSPEGHSPESYAAALAVAPVDPRCPGSIPLFHLLRDDLGLLHRLMEEWRLTALGPLEVLLGDKRGAERLGGAWGKLRRRASLARLWCDIWRRGRGRPVDGPALEASGVLSATFFGRVLSLAEDCGGDGAALIAALREGRISRFRAETIDQLESHLAEEGYIDEGERLDEAGRRQALLLEGAADAGEIQAVVDWLEAGLLVDGGPAETEKGRISAEE